MNTNQVNSYTLSNGVVIEVATSKRNSTGYEGASFSPAWTRNSEKPFIAVGNRDIENAHLLKGYGGNVWHGGYYDDVRKAAYVASLFKANPLETDFIVYAQNREFVDFPSDLFDLPESLTHEEAVKRINIALANKPKKEKPLFKTSDKCDKVWAKLYETYNFAELAKQFGKDVFIQARKTFTVGELQDKLGLPVL